MKVIGLLTFTSFAAIGGISVMVPLTRISAAQPIVVREDSCGQQLLLQVVATHPEIRGAMIDATPTGGSQSLTIAATDRRLIGRASGAAALSVAKSGSTSVVKNGAAGVLIAMPLRNVSGDVVAQIGLVYAKQSGTDAVLIDKARDVRDELTMGISRFDDLLEPYPSAGYR